MVAVNGAGDVGAAVQAHYITATLFSEGAGTTVAVVPAAATALEVYDLAGRQLGGYGTALGTVIGAELPAGQYLIRPVGARAHAPQRFVVQ